MATANLTLPDGSKVAIEGTAEEVALLIAKVSSSGGKNSPNQPERNKPPRRGHSGKQKQKRGAGPRGLVEQLVQEDYFKGQRRTIGDIQKKLEESGHIYAQNSLSPALLRLTRARTLRRIKEKKGWVYVK